ncbi:MAG: hypothetical protein Q6370_011625 [Candidatus Sigynarchaeota archaeon]
MPSDSGASGSDKGAVLKLKKVIMASIPHGKFVPLVIKIQKPGTFMLGARLTPHGGEIAVELARKLARKAALRLIVLGTNVITFLLMDVDSIISSNSNDNQLNTDVNIDGYHYIEESIEKLSKVTDDFHARITALLE